MGGQVAKGGGEWDNCPKTWFTAFVRDQGCLTWTNYTAEAEEGQRRPNTLLCGVVVLLLRTGFGPCHARRRNMVRGLIPDSSVWCWYQIPRPKGSSLEPLDDIAPCSKIRLVSAVHPPRMFAFPSAPLFPQHHLANFLSGIH